MTHAYTSTACHHGLHQRCRRTCKFCGQPCLCPCGHREPTPVERRAFLDEFRATVTDAEIAGTVDYLCHHPGCGRHIPCRRHDTTTQGDQQ